MGGEPTRSAPERPFALRWGPGCDQSGPMEWIAGASLVIAAAALWNSYAMQQRVKRLEELTGHRIDGEKYEGLSPRSETR